jgi:hypothetical protein
MPSGQLQFWLLKTVTFKYLRRPHTSVHLHALVLPLNGDWGLRFEHIPMPSTIQNLVSSHTIHLFPSITTTPPFVSVPSNAPENRMSAQLRVRHP